VANYLDRQSASDAGLAGYVIQEKSTNNGLIYLAVDHHTTIDNIGAAGRNSVRLESIDTFSTGLWIADIAHMPSSTCGVWPAYWLLGTSAPWPSAGEVDILEGINDNIDNTIALHTDKDITVTNLTNSDRSFQMPMGNTTTAMTMNMTTMNGQFTSTDCNHDRSGGKGCAVTDSVGNYGTSFNLKSGGYLITEVTDSSITIWSIPRGSTPTKPDASQR
jgi:hypothetical protein